METNTVCDWYNFCREICEKANENHWESTKLGNGQRRRPGPNNIPETLVQMDESLLRGKAKYGRGRRLLGDIATNAVAGTDDELDELHQNVHRNFGNRIEGPWIFGLVECHLVNGSFKTGEVRLFHVLRRDAITLGTIIRDHVQPNSTIWSDDWRGYAGLNHDFYHEVVNHSNEYVTENGVHSQNVERMWKQLKLKVMKLMSGTNANLLPTHLAEYCWRSRFIHLSKWELFEKFIEEAVFQNPIIW